MQKIGGCNGHSNPKEQLDLDLQICRYFRNLLIELTVFGFV